MKKTTIVILTLILVIISQHLAYTRGNSFKIGRRREGKISASQKFKAYSKMGDINSFYIGNHIIKLNRVWDETPEEPEDEELPIQI